MGARSFPPRSLYYGLLLVAGLFVWRSSGLLPERMASHFGASGVPNAWMPRGDYLRLMLLVTVALPAGLSLLVEALARGTDRLRIPNAAYWLTPERRAASIAFMIGHARWFGCLLSGFLCYVHWLVIEANRVQPPELPATRMVWGLALFGLCNLAWAAAMLWRFRRAAPPA